MVEDFGPGGAVFLRAPFRGVVADAVPGTDENLPIGHRPESCIPSWPAPLGRPNGWKPSPSHAASMASRAAPEHGTGGSLWRVSVSSPTPRCSQTRAASSAMRASRRSRTSPSTSRRSTVKVARPGMTFTPPGSTSIRPTVPTLVPLLSASRSTAPTAAAAARASRRNGPIGVASAWPASPLRTNRNHTGPAMPVTTPTGRPRCSRTRPCSMCSSTYAWTEPGPRAASPMRSGARPASRIASATVTPFRPRGKGHPGRGGRRGRGSRSCRARPAIPPRP
jgi:hypothetical protein